MNVELLVNRMIKAGIVEGRHDQRLRKQEFTIEDWTALHPALQEYHMIVSPRQVDQVLAEIDQQKRKDADDAEAARRARAARLHNGELPADADSDEADRIETVVDLFIANYPQYCTDNQQEVKYGKHNYAQIMARLRERGRYADDLEALVASFEELTAAGKLYVDLRPLGLGDRIITGYALQTHPQLDRILAPVHKADRLAHLSADQYREYNNKLDREAGIKSPRSARAESEMEQMLAVWYDSAAGAGYGVFENQTRADVKRLIFEHLDEEEIPYSVGAVQRAAQYLHSRGVLHRDSDVYGGTTGEFVAPGARLVVHPTAKNPILNPPPQNIEIVERTKKVTLQDLRKMSSSEYAAALSNPTLAPQIEALLNK
jgi:hypothetical protein